MFEDEGLPQRKPAMLERHVLDGWSVADLNAYIEALQAEIARAKTFIDKKTRRPRPRRQLLQARELAVSFQSSDRQ